MIYEYDANNVDALHPKEVDSGSYPRDGLADVNNNHTCARILYMVNMMRNAAFTICSRSLRIASLEAFVHVRSRKHQEQQACTDYVHHVPHVGTIYSGVDDTSISIVSWTKLTGVAQHDFIVCCGEFKKEKTMNYVHCDCAHSSNLSAMLIIATAVLATPASDEPDDAGEFPALPEDALARGEAGVSAADAVRFIFKICSMSCSDKVLALLLRRLAFCLVFFNCRITAFRSVRMREASNRKSRILSSHGSTLLNAASSMLCVGRGSPWLGELVPCGVATTLSAASLLASMSGIAAARCSKRSESSSARCFLASKRLIQRADHDLDFAGAISPAKNQERNRQHLRVGCPTWL